MHDENESGPSSQAANFLADCKIIVNNGEATFYANSTALALNSRFFFYAVKKQLPKTYQVPFGANISMPVTCLITYPDIDVVNALLDFIVLVSSKSKLSPDDLFVLLKIDGLKTRLRAAKDFCVPRLIDAIVSSALSNINAKNCWQIMAIAADPECSCELLEAVVNEYALCNFYKIVSEPDFLRFVSYYQLLDLLGSIRLNAPCESELVYVLCNWINWRWNHANRYDARGFASLLRCLRIGGLTDDEVRGICNSHLVRVTKSIIPSILEDISEAVSIKYNERRLYHSFRLPHEAIFQCGGLELQFPQMRLAMSRAVSVYDAVANRWTLHDKFLPALETRLIHSSCVELDSVVYLIGGVTQPRDASYRDTSSLSIVSRVQAYDLRKCLWRDRSPLQVGRFLFGACTCNGMIYALGGRTHLSRGITSSVEIYDPSVNSWIHGVDMSCGRAEFGVASLKGIIYVCGGILRRQGNAALSTMEQFNPTTGQWTVLSQLPSGLAGLSLCAFDNFIFAMGGCQGNTVSSAVYRYDPSINRWSIVQSMNSARCYFSSCVLYDHIYVIGGRTEHANRPSVSYFQAERYSREGTWRRCPAGSELTEGCCCTIFNCDLIQPLVK